MASMNDSLSADRVRKYKNAGMSERSAVLKDIKRTKADRKRESKKHKAMPMGPDVDEYPYGTRIDLDHDTLDKLGMKTMPKAGRKMKLHADVHVHRSEESTHSERGQKPSKRRSLTLQIRKMALK